MKQAIYFNYSREHSDRVDGFLVIQEEWVEKQPKDVVVFSISDFGSIIKQDGKYISYFVCIEDFWNYMDPRNFGNPQTSFKLALEVLVEEQNYKIVLKPPFYRKEVIENKIEVELP